MVQKRDIEKRRKRVLSIILAFVMIIGSVSGISLRSSGASDYETLIIPANTEFTIDGDTFEYNEITYDVTTLKQIEIGANSSCVINVDIDNSNLGIRGDDSSKLVVSSGKLLSCEGISCGIINNYGTIAATASLYCGVDGQNEGMMKGRFTLGSGGTFVNTHDMSLNSVEVHTGPTSDKVTTFKNQGDIEVSSSSGVDFTSTGNIRIELVSGSLTASAIKVNKSVVSTSDSFKYNVRSEASFEGYGSSDTIGHLHVDNEEALLYASDGTLYLEIASNPEITHTGPIASGTKAGALLGDDFDVSWDSSMPPIYQGVTNYNLQEYMVIDAGSNTYDEEGDVRLTYDDGTSTQPTTSGEHKLNYSIIAKGTFRQKTGSLTYTIIPLPLDSSMGVSGGGYLTMEGLSNDKYVNTEKGVILKPATGYKVSVDGGEYSSSVALKKLDSSANFSLKRESDGAETKPFGYSTMAPGLSNLIFDEQNPVISKSYLDDELKSIDLDGTVRAKKLQLTIEDTNLDKVVTSDGEELATVKESGSTRIAELTFESTLDKTTDIEFWAYDKSGRSTKINFKLAYALIKPDAKLTVADIKYGQEITPVLETNSDGKAKVTYEYKKDGQDDKDYSNKVPTAVGTYVVRATIPATEKYTSVQCTAKFSIVRKSVGKTKVEIEDTYVGKDYEPVLTTDSDGKSKAVFTYKEKDESDDAYTTKKPKKAGTYIVKASIPATDKYEATTCTCEFKIKYLSDVKYTISGNKGKNGYYTSDVYLVAPKGYVISSKYDGDYKQRILYKSDMDKVYIKRESDGAQSDEMSVEKLKIDKDAPKYACNVSGKVISIEDGKEIYQDTLTITVSDEHLSKVSLDGNDVKIVDNIATIDLDAEDGEKSFTITTEDEAGNENNIKLVLMSSWLEDGKVPSGRKLPLVKGKKYNFEIGKWTVSGDSTVYNGGSAFYVVAPGDYTFTKQ